MLFTVEDDVLHHVVSILALRKIQTHLEQLFQYQIFVWLSLTILQVFLNHSTSVWMKS